MAEQQTIPKQSLEEAWPAEGLTRVPFRVFQTEESYRTEQQRIFHGPSWHYLALEVELPEPGDFRTTKIGDTPVDIAEGLNAGMWTIGITATGNEVGLSQAEWDALPADEQALREQSAVQRLTGAGAHYTAPSLADCTMLLADIERRIASGEKP